MAANRWRLEGQLALVTGASAGIGLAITRELLGFGADVLMVTAPQLPQVPEFVRDTSRRHHMRGQRRHYRALR